MGKRQLGEMNVSELVSTLLVSEIASIPIDDPDIPLMNAIIPILLILSLEIILSTIKNKSEKMKEIVEGKPQYIIYKGRLLQKALKDNRISVNELLSELRAQGIGSIEDVYYAAVEQNGTLSVIKNTDNEIAHPLIIDGQVLSENLRALGYDDIWLTKQLGTMRKRAQEVFLMTVTDKGRIHLIAKDRDKK
jgi:uncharacterized membrane protein YcaP (DUF421 family)